MGRAQKCTQTCGSHTQKIQRPWLLDVAPYGNLAGDDNRIAAGGFLALCAGAMVVVPLAFVAVATVVVVVAVAGGGAVFEVIETDKVAAGAVGSAGGGGGGHDVVVAALAPAVVAAAGAARAGAVAVAALGPLVGLVVAADGRAHHGPAQVLVAQRDDDDAQHRQAGADDGHVELALAP